MRFLISFVLFAGLQLTLHAEDPETLFARYRSVEHARSEVLDSARLYTGDDFEDFTATAYRGCLDSIVFLTVSHCSQQVREEFTQAFMALPTDKDYRLTAEQTDPEGLRFYRVLQRKTNGQIDRTVIFSCKYKGTAVGAMLFCGKFEEFRDYEFIDF